jgi:hypothetical protein
VGPRLVTVAALLLAGGVAAPAQEVPLEYRVKAAYLANFARFVEWPAAAAAGPLVICVAGTNPFGMVLEETIAGETVNGRALAVRAIDVPDPSCHVLFVPRTVGAGPYIRSALTGSIPTLTVGETPAFIDAGGLVNFVREGNNVRFEIDAGAASRAGLRISSRLLRLARIR